MFPSNDELPRVVVPPPPFLPADMDDREAMTRLLRYYNAACEQAIGQKVHLIAKRPRVRDFDEPALRRAVYALRDHRIAPAAWAQFMLGIWKSLEQKERRGRLFPPLSFVWSEKWIRDPNRRRWYYEMRKTYSGGQIVPVAERQEFIRRYDVMLDDLKRELVTYEEPERVRAIVARHFPGDSFRELIMRAWHESKAVHAAMREQVDAGGWVWR